MMQAWLYPASPDSVQAIYRSFRESFPYVELFPALNNNGVHMVGSLEPINVGETRDLIQRMPIRARDDLLEWSDSHDAIADLDAVLSHTVIESTVLNPDPNVHVTDDRPYNEYFFLRRLFRIGAAAK